MHLRHDGLTQPPAWWATAWAVPPHGDCRCTTPWCAWPRMPCCTLVDGQGFPADDTQAAMRYTERARGDRRDDAADIDKDTVDFKDNLTARARAHRVAHALPEPPNAPPIAVDLHQHPAPQPGETGRRGAPKRWTARPGDGQGADEARAGAGPPHGCDPVLPPRPGHRKRGHGPRGYETGNTTPSAVRADIHYAASPRSSRSPLPGAKEHHSSVAADRDLPGITDVRDESDYHGMRVALMARGPTGARRSRPVHLHPDARQPVVQRDGLGARRRRAARAR